MAISVSPTFVISVPKADFTLIQSTPTEIRQLDSNTFRQWLHAWAQSDDGRACPFPFRHNTQYTIDGLTYARSIELVAPYTFTPEDGQYQLNIIGSNNNIHSRRNLNSVSIVPSNSAGLIGLQSISDNSEYASYAGGVTIDVANGYPMNTPGKLVGSQIAPVNNAAEAKLIATDRGFTKLFVVGSLTLSGSDFDYFDIYGRNTFLTVSGIGHARFYDCMVSGSIGRDCRFTDSALGSITATNGYMHLMHCGIAGPVYLSACTAIVQECSSAVSGENDTIFDFTNTASGLEARSFTGAMKLRNKNGAQVVTIDMAGGQVTVDSTVSNGTIILRGTASSYDNSTGTAVVKKHSLMNPINITATTNVLVEGMRPHHTGTGNIFYWDPDGGSNTNDGLSPTNACATFAHIHDNLVQDYNHDIVYAYAGGSLGTTVSTENLVITKNFVFLRGPGKNFKIQSTNDAIDAIYITGDGVQVEKLVISDMPTNTKHAIWCSGDFANFSHVIVNNCNKGIELVGSHFSSVDACDVQDNLGYGLKVAGASSRVNIYRSHFGDNLGNGITIDNAGGTDIVIHNENIIHGNAGYGVDIVAGSVDTTIHADVNIYGNTLGQVRDNGTGTYIESDAILADTAAAVWAKALDGLTAEQIMKVTLAALAGKRSGLGTATETRYDNAGTTPVITFTPSDAESNGTPTLTP